MNAAILFNIMKNLPKSGMVINDIIIMSEWILNINMDDEQLKDIIIRVINQKNNYTQVIDNFNIGIVKIEYRGIPLNKHIKRNTSACFGYRWIVPIIFNMSLEFLDLLITFYSKVISIITKLWYYDNGEAYYTWVCSRIETIYSILLTIESKVKHGYKNDQFVKMSFKYVSMLRLAEKHRSVNLISDKTYDIIGMTPVDGHNLCYMYENMAKNSTRDCIYPQYVMYAVINNLLIAETYELYDLFYSGLYILARLFQQYYIKPEHVLKEFNRSANVIDKYLRPVKFTKTLSILKKKPIQILTIAVLNISQDEYILRGDIYSMIAELAHNDRELLLVTKINSDIATECYKKANDNFGLGMHYKVMAVRLILEANQEDHIEKMETAERLLLESYKISKDSYHVLGMAMAKTGLGILYFNKSLYLGNAIIDVRNPYRETIIKSINEIKEGIKILEMTKRYRTIGLMYRQLISGYRGLLTVEDDNSRKASYLQSIIRCIMTMTNSFIADEYLPNLEDAVRHLRYMIELINLKENEKLIREVLKAFDDILILADKHQELWARDYASGIKTAIQDMKSRISSV